MKRPRITWDLKKMPWNYVPRRDMPQVDEDDETALVEWLTFIGVPVTQVTLDPNRLVFHQHVDENLVMREMPSEIYSKPIWVSSDGCIIDGNHRATAHIQRGDDTINALQVALPFEQAVAAIFTFAGTYDYAERNRNAKAD